MRLVAAREGSYFFSTSLGQVFTSSRVQDRCYYVDMTLIKKKTWPAEFGVIMSGKKTYELRLGDMKVAEGDTLLLQEWDTEKQTYTGREISKEVTYVRKFMIDQLYWPKEEILEKGLWLFRYVNS